MKPSKLSGDQTVYEICQAESGAPHRRSLPTAARQRRHPLCVEKEVRPCRREQTTPTPAAGAAE